MVQERSGRKKKLRFFCDISLAGDFSFFIFFPPLSFLICVHNLFLLITIRTTNSSSSSSMAYFSDFVKSTLSKVVLGKEIPAFPYTIGERVDSFDSSIWALHKGIKRVRRDRQQRLC